MAVNRAGKEGLAQSLGRRQQMKFYSPKDFTADRAWGAIQIAKMNGITVKMHWTDQPYKWHQNDGEEVFAVLDGHVEMHYRENGEEKMRLMNTGDLFYASVGTEHLASPIGQARILVIEKEGSI